MIEKIICQNKILSIIIRTQFQINGIKFFTPDTFSQQLAYMNRPAGHIVHSHIHKSVPREVQFTQEVLFIKRGKVRVDFYNEQKKYIESRILSTGDVILLAGGGHGIMMLEETDIIEVKQGPYAAEEDKIIFDPVKESEILIKQ